MIRPTDPGDDWGSPPPDTMGGWLNRQADRLLALPPWHVASFATALIATWVLVGAALSPSSPARVTPALITACVSACGDRGPVRVTPSECVCAPTGGEDDAPGDLPTQAIEEP